MNRLCITLLAAVLLAGCAASRPAYERDRSLAYVCYPGSAIKRLVSSDSAYPDYMYVERGSCLHH